MCRWWGGLGRNEARRFRSKISEGEDYKIIQFEIMKRREK